ncbi:zinc finger protein OZF-like [Rhipicephalus sanguineus]|uniref:zinc finger protein OZF-like n=1 Tax=Rhipicephalus sanguineus TaxID=34632 RepID=UPI0020C3E47B|nr:zinc finger protein OZF-like [Rhipicephalus sanguineus]
MDGKQTSEPAVVLPEFISSTPETCSAETSRGAAITDGSRRTADGTLVGPVKKHGGKCHECTVCGRRFTRKQYLDDHRILHTGEKPHVCPVCGRSFAQRNGYIHHQRIHTKWMPYACELCPSKFCRKESLNRHKQLHASGVELYHCDECSKVFTSRLVLQRHQWWHKGEKPYPCRLCPATFVYSKDLDRHSLVHTGERPYTCSVCHKSFAWKKNLKLHMHRVHSGPVESVASVIGIAELTQSRDEKIFRMLPCADKEFSCHLCPAVFDCSSDMDKHVVVHIGERPHVCPVCRKRFAWENNLVLHMRRRHGGVKTSVTAANSSGESTLPNDLPSTLAPEVTSTNKMEESSRPTSMLAPISANVDIKAEPSSPGTTPPPNRSNVDIKAEPCSPAASLPPVMTCTDIKAEPSSPTTRLPSMCVELCPRAICAVEPGAIASPLTRSIQHPTAYTYKLP